MKTLLIMGMELKNLVTTKKVLVISLIYVAIYLVGVRVANLFDFVSFFVKDIRMGIPYSVGLPFFISTTVLPFLCFFATYDIISRQYENRSLKYLAYRVSRINILSGKILAPLILIGFLNALLYIYSYYKGASKGSDFSSLLVTLFAFSFVIIMLYLFYGVFFSIIMKTGMGSFWNGFLGLIVIYGFGFVNFGPLAILSPVYYAKEALNVFKYNSFNNLFFMIPIFIAILMLLSYVIFYREDIY